MTLEEIPRIRDQIISLWGKPGCADYLEKLLRDNRDGQRRGFSLPVVEEVLFLIDLAAAREAARKDPQQP
jgi:pilus assembly protein FimV